MNRQGLSLSDLDHPPITRYAKFSQIWQTNHEIRITPHFQMFAKRCSAYSVFIYRRKKMSWRQGRKNWKWYLVLRRQNIPFEEALKRVNLEEFQSAVLLLNVPPAASVNRANLQSLAMALSFPSPGQKGQHAQGSLHFPQTLEELETTQRKQLREHGALRKRCQRGDRAIRRGEVQRMSLPGGKAPATGCTVWVLGFQNSIMKAKP